MNRSVLLAILILSLHRPMSVVASDRAKEHVVAGVVVKSTGEVVGKAYVAAMSISESGVASSVNWIRADEGGGSGSR